MARTRNTLLESVINELGWSQERVAAHFRRTAAEHAASELLTVTRSHINQWVRGSRPSAPAPDILCETLSRGLGRVVTLAQIGLAPSTPVPPTTWDWDADTVVQLVDIGGDSMRDLTRRKLLGYSAAGAGLPSEPWWRERAQQAQERRSLSRRTISPAHVEAVREAMHHYSRQDQRLGGDAGRAALLAYLQHDVADYLSRRVSCEGLRRELYSAAAELVYLAGWMSFDASDHGQAQQCFTLAFRIAAEADDAPLAGHILRAAAHQAIDLGHPQRALDIAEGSLTQGRYALASPREKALLGVVHARALAAAQHKQAALAALRRAEDDLGRAREDLEPSRVFFFGEASLAHETACTLRDLGDLKGAEAEFQRSVRTRGKPFLRTHAVTLGYLGDVQVRQGHLDAACQTWGQALDVIDGIQSGRVRDTVVHMRRALSPVRGRGGSAASEVDRRAAAVLRGVG
ncbi:Tat pathway signal protein [Streptomyces sp. NPDC059991]|uniref:Tat pathway signal protein n=1 Tax=Streptomyces sp. NPDC059991 TaxID=3347028 RepID=UPI0036B9704B